MFGNRKKYIEQNNYFTKKDCPFCKTNEDEKKFFLHQTQYWKVVYNKFPYYGIKKHLMSAPKRHIRYTTELNNLELLDFKNIELFMQNYYKGDNNYYSFIRQSIGGRSVEHLHYHYLPGHISYDEKSRENIFRIKNK